jgi:uncharacterized membrane protein
VRGHKDLTLTAAAAAISALLALVLPVPWLSLLVGLPLFFLLPGYALASLVFARRPRGLAPLLALALGLSLSVLALGSLFLNYMPGGLRAVPWALFLALVTLLACRGAALRRGRDHQVPLPRVRRPALSAGSVMAAAGAALGIAAIALGFVTFKASDAVGFTELWTRSAPATEALRIGVGSQEQEETAYRLEIKRPRRPKTAARSLSLGPGETAVLRVPLPGTPATQPERVIVTLYKAHSPGRPYRRVNAWIGTEGAGG